MHQTVGNPSATAKPALVHRQPICTGGHRLPVRNIFQVPVRQRQASFSSGTTLPPTSWQEWEGYWHSQAWNDNWLYPPGKQPPMA